jgi:hypothetical protein
MFKPDTFRLCTCSSYPTLRLDMLLGLQEVEPPGISRQSVYEGGNFASSTNWSPLHPSFQEIPKVLISITGCFEPMALVLLEGLR